MSTPSLRVESKPNHSYSTSSSEADSARIDAGRLQGSRFLSASIKDWWVKGVMRPIEDFCANHRITPNVITTTGFLLTVLAAILLATHHFIWGGWMVIWGGCCDFLDGRIARRMNLQTVSGSFFDSVLDRYADAAVLFALAFLFRDSWVSILVWIALLGSMTTPYIRAKSEVFGIDQKAGQMQRPERIVYIGLGSALAGYMECLELPFMKAGARPTPYILIFCIAVVAFMSNKVALTRAISTFRSLKARDHSGSH